MNKAKVKGTAAESAVVGYLHANGFPFAERRALAGAGDKGDIAGIPGVVIEVKNCAEQKLAAWLDETEVEKRTAAATIGVAWFKRRGKSDPGQWFVLMTGQQFVEMIRD
jgi:Holliday junction resolvase